METYRVGWHLESRLTDGTAIGSLTRRPAALSSLLEDSSYCFLLRAKSSLGP